MHRTRNAACPRGYRGFESLPLRQFPWAPRYAPDTLLRSGIRKGIVSVVGAASGMTPAMALPPLELRPPAHAGHGIGAVTMPAEDDTAKHVDPACAEFAEYPTVDRIRSTGQHRAVARHAGDGGGHGEQLPPNYVARLSLSAAIPGHAAMSSDTPRSFRCSAAGATTFLTSEAAGLVAHARDVTE